MNIKEIAAKEIETRLETMIRAIDSARGAHVMDLDTLVERVADYSERQPFHCYESTVVETIYNDSKLLRDRTATLRDLHNEAHTLKLMGVDSERNYERLEKLEANYEAYRKSTLGLKNRLKFPSSERGVTAEAYFGHPGEFWPA